MRARIRTPAGRSIHVAIEDLSASGCRIEKPEYEIIPERFTLRFSDGRADTLAEIVWQKGNSIGAQFIDAAADSPPAPRPAPEVPKISLNDLRRLARGSH